MSIGIRILLFLLMFLAPLQIGWIFRHNNGIYIVDGILFGLLFASFFRPGKFRFHGAPLVLTFIAWCLISSVFSTRPDIAFSEVTRLARAYLGFLLICNLTKTKKDFDAVFYGLIATVAFNAFIGFLEWRRGFLGLTFLGEDSFYYRAGGLFTHPNIYGSFLIMLLPILLRLFIFYKHKKKSHLAMYGILSMITVAALLATYSRGSWLSFAGAIVVMLLYSLFKIKFYPKVISATAVIVLLGTVVAVHYAPTILSQFQGEYRGRAATVRLPLNRIALKMTMDNPIFGVGLGNYTEHTVLYAEDEISDEHHYWELLQIVHNTHLLNLAEAGPIGFLLILGMLFWIFKFGLKAVNINNRFSSNIALGLLTGYVAVLIAWMAGPDGRNHQIQMMFWLSAGLLYTLTRFKAQKPGAKNKFKKVSGKRVGIPNQMTQSINNNQNQLEKVNGRQTSHIRHNRNL